MKRRGCVRPANNSAAGAQVEGDLGDGSQCLVPRWSPRRTLKGSRHQLLCGLRLFSGMSMKYVRALFLDLQCFLKTFCFLFKAKWDEMSYFPDTVPSSLHCSRVSLAKGRRAEALGSEMLLLRFLRRGNLWLLCRFCYCFDGVFLFLFFVASIV